MGKSIGKHNTAAEVLREREVWQALGKTSQGKEAAGILQQACMLQP